MRNDLILDPHCITGESSVWDDDFAESIFFTGNGRMGVRGYLPFEGSERGAAKGLYMAGMFGEIKPGITDLVNLPTPVQDKLLIGGKPAELSSKIERKYDLDHGFVSFSFKLKAGENEVFLRHERFFDEENPALFLQRTVIKNEGGTNAELSLTSGISPFSCNCPVPDDQVKSNDELVNLATQTELDLSYNKIHAAYELRGTGLKLTEDVVFAINRNCETSRDAALPLLTFKMSLEAGGEVTIDKITSLLSSRDVDTRIKPYDGVKDYDAIKEAHDLAFSKKMAAFSEETAISDPELLCGLKYSMMQLYMNCAGGDPTVNIGARGISHGRYKGCYFWDTDLFMLPFFIKNDLTAAKNLCMYRVNMLDAARKNAAKMNGKGARYPWMSALDGSEQCETWDIGCSEVHVTADVVYALENYHTASKDESFYLDNAAKVYVETARFWESRYTWTEDKTRANLLFCKGPDEYCGITSNNLFTNVMVKNNLKLAIKAAKDLKDNRPDTYASLTITDEEIKAWQKLHDCIILPHDPYTGRLTTDETFHLLETVSKGAVKSGDEASYHNVSFDRLQRYKLVKQADVLLIMTRFPSEFTEKEKLDAWKDFEPICLHDSTLSFASHALFALQNGLISEGNEYLRKALLLDLRDIMSNTGHEGLHLACMGEAWSAANEIK